MTTMLDYAHSARIQWTDDDDKLPGYVTDGGQQTSSTRTREDRANGLLEV